MKVGIIGAMEQEVTFLLKKMNNLQIIKLAGCKIYIGILNGIETTLLKSGIGKTAASISTTIMLTLCKPDLVINIGSAGSLIPKLKIGDIVVSDKVSYYDADLTVFGYKPGQMSGCPAVFCADKKLLSSTENVIKQFNINAIRGLIVSGDTFVSSAELLVRICQIFPNAIAVEMEAAAIGHVCYKFNVPFVVIRAISDIVNQTSYLSFNTFLDTAAIQSSLVVENLLLQL